MIEVRLESEGFVVQRRCLYCDRVLEAGQRCTCAAAVAAQKEREQRQQAVDRDRVLRSTDSNSRQSSTEPQMKNETHSNASQQTSDPNVRREADFSASQGKSSLTWQEKFKQRFSREKTSSKAGADTGAQSGVQAGADTAEKEKTGATQAGPARDSAWLQHIKTVTQNILRAIRAFFAPGWVYRLMQKFRKLYRTTLLIFFNPEFFVESRQRGKRINSWILYVCCALGSGLLFSSWVRYSSVGSALIFSERGLSRLTGVDTSLFFVRGFLVAMTYLFLHVLGLHFITKVWRSRGEKSGLIETMHIFSPGVAYLLVAQLVACCFVRGSGVTAILLLAWGFAAKMVVDILALKKRYALKGAQVFPMILGANFFILVALGALIQFVLPSIRGQSAWVGSLF